MIATTDPGTLLLLEKADLRPTDRAWVLSAADPALVLGTAERAASVVVVEFSFTAQHRLVEAIGRRTPQATRLVVRTIDTIVEPDFPSTLATVALLAIPKGREVARALLWSALRVLAPGGRLYLAGPNAGGAKSIFDDAATLFGRCVTLATRKRHRIGVAIRPDEPSAYPWELEPFAMQQRTFNMPNQAIDVMTMPGVFSWEHLDEGTALLLDHVEINPDEDVLDVGCGNGIVGAFAARRARSVLMIDENYLAVRCARQTIRLNQLTNACAQPGDVYDGLDGHMFDLIVSNPPFHKQFEVDTGVLFRLISGASAHLRSGGRLVIVANAFLNYEKRIAQHFPKSRVLARNSKYMVIEGSLGR